MSDVFNMRIDRATQRKLTSLARATGNSRAAVVRWLIHDAARKLGANGDKSPQKRAPVESAVVSPQSSRAVEVEHEYA